MPSVTDTISEAVRESIEANGGLLGQGDIAARLDVSRERARQLTGTPGFPQPVAHVALPGGRHVPLWLGADIDQWERRRRERLKKRAQRGTPGKRMRGPRPTSLSDSQPPAP